MRSYSITLPELPDSSAMPDDYDLQSLLSSVAERIGNKKEWSVKTDIYLGLFSFQKFVMYKDLEANAERFSLHRILRQIVLRSGSQLVGLPSDVRAMELDQDFSPETTFQVVDADSSQLRAIAACSRKRRHPRSAGLFIAAIMVSSALRSRDTVTRRRSLHSATGARCAAWPGLPRAT